MGETNGAQSTIPVEETEIYGWLNKLTKETGLSASTVSELYLNGWIVREDIWNYEEENLPGVGVEVSFWKRFK